MAGGRFSHGMRIATSQVEGEGADAVRSVLEDPPPISMGGRTYPLRS